MPGYFEAMLHAPPKAPTQMPLELYARRLEFLPDAERAFFHLYGKSPNAFWLDSSCAGEHARFSFMGDSRGPLGALISYDVEGGEVRVERGGEVEVLGESIFDYLARETRRLRLPPNDLPFDFDCGFAGYFGYELKAECDGDAAHESLLPDAAFVLADRLIAFDRVDRCAYVLCLTDAGGADEGEGWIEETCLRLSSLPPLDSVEREPPAEPVEFRLSRSHPRYLEDIAECKRRLFAGETYEVCLTNRIAADLPGEDPLGLYRVLRQVNPAPFAAFLRFGDVAVLSSSPERFLAVGRDRWVEARPIKGTCRRGETPEEDIGLAAELRADPKSRSENVTIVDLLRNDLGSCCEFGSVHAPDLMRVETYETVHQLVSTVRGQLRAGLSPVDCVRACFPPGSMTGAPKKRTMEIIDELEGEARGPYSGAIGYLGLGGACDLSVAIRAIVLDGGAATIGVGGAIVIESDPEAEYREAMLKGRAPVRAINPMAE